MPQAIEPNQPGTDAFVRDVVQKYRTKLLDLTSRNPLISFRHSERSRSHIRVIDEIPEKLFNKLVAGKELFFEPLPDPELTPRDEDTPMFMSLLRRAKAEDQAYKEALNELGPNPSTRQKQKIERELRNRVREKFGLAAFHPTWEPSRRAKEMCLNPDYELPAPDGQTPRRHKDSKIQALFFAEELERKLSGLRDAARVLEKDAGFNALFCTFGYMEYYESDHSDERRVAPLVFLPVVLDRVLVDQRYRYFIKSRNEDVEINIALAELLKQMAVNLPLWEDDEEDENPLGTYLDRVGQAIAEKRDWKLRRYVTIGLFTFSTLAMYKDLDPQRWPDADPLEQRQILRTLIAGAEISEVKYADDYEIDKLQGPEPLLITDADSSQHSAVVDALRSKTSQVIQGPPGTGKSQTITNIIAAALNEGMSVLFVAEKMAALEVVKKRLDAAGLEAFCLELHSSKTSKTAVTGSLAQRLEYRAPRLRPELAQSNADALSDARSELLYYVQRVNQDAGRTGLKFYDLLLGSAIREGLRKDLPASIVDARFGYPLEISPHSYRQMLDAATTLEAQMQPLAVFGKLADHPWRGVQNIEITELDENRLTALLSEWNAAICTLLDAIAAVAQNAGLPMPDTQVALEALCQRVIEVAPVPHLISVETYRACSTESNRKRLRETLEHFEALRGLEKSLGSYTTNLALARQVGSKSTGNALAALRELGLKQFTVGSVAELKSEHQKGAVLLARAEPLCTALVHAVGLRETNIASLRCAVAAIELLGRLPRPLWTRRSPAILDEANRTVLDRASIQTSALIRRRTDLQAAFDLQLLPSHQELITYGVALKSAGFLGALFSSSCRQGRRIFLGAARDPTKKRRKAMADGLLRCAGYLADIGTLEANSALKSICGPHYAGLDTPFAELAAVSSWGSDVRQRLALFGDTGFAIRDFLFTANIDQFDRLLALREHAAFEPLTEALRKFVQEDSILWNDLVQRQRTLADRLASVTVVFERAAFRNTCNQTEIASARDTLDAAEKCTAEIEADVTALALVGGSLDELRRNVEALTATLNFADRVASLTIPQPLVQYFFADPDHISATQDAARGLLSASSAVMLRAEEANELAQIDPKLWCGTEAFEHAPLHQLLARNARALEHVAALRDYLNFLLAEDAASDQGIGPVLSVYSTSGLDYSNLTRAVEFVFYRSAAATVLNSDPRLRRHSGATHQELRKQFRALDCEYLELRRKQLAVNLAQRPCPAGNSFGPVGELTELALVTRVAGQTRPRIAMRDLIRRAGKAMQALKPCWMMSPMSVAQYIEQGKLGFDLVIMDEASQIRPEEALGAIARGEKAVIVGDQMQLPPTPFFQKLSVGDVSDDENFEESRQDSVLEAAAGRFYPSRTLKWHYRSEHGSLIAFSNHEFYRDKLTVFPSPYYDHPEYGVSFVQTSGIYDSGLNEIEGEAVVQAAVGFMKQCPDQSLGIVAVNSKQAEFIREQLDRECATDENAAAYVQKWEPTLESVFVKNLENVQGDERDAIFISTVYGKDRNGNFYQRFGPINGVYGHRRLNVLFTRAKKKVIVFTSMVPEEIQDEGKQWGVKVLKEYLQFARDGIATIPTTRGECESEFEQWVLQVLQAHGYQGEPQVGVCGYRIDIAVRHPARPGVFLCGIECDGATYHSARSVRERDRLRQEILEKYGWKLYRIWSTDWFRNPNLQTKQLLRYLQQLHPPVV
jgi:very-short-patch-repair endonuclease